MSVGSTSAKRNNEDTFMSEGILGNGAKKMKFDASPPSRVVHLRSLPMDVIEREVIQLGMTYGKVTNLLMLKGKNQAFLEMEDEDVASQMVEASEANPPTIRQRIIYIQFSNHKELKTDNSPGQMQAESLLHAMQQSEGGANHVLRAVVENMQYPITVEVLHKIFVRFGSVLKIITFNKNNQFQALIQMADAIQSQTAKLSLDGQNIYNNCCTLRIEYSKLTTLNVKYNNEKSFDFTRPDLPSGDGPGSSLLGNAALQMPGSRGGRGLMPAPFPSQNALAAVLQQSQLASLVSRSAGNALGTGFQPDIAALTAHLVGAQNSVLHVSNLNAEMVTPKALFTLFGVYGDVMRVKILFQRKDNALIQMADHSQAQQVIKNLNGVYLFDRPLQIRTSKHNQVQMPREGQDSEKLTQDYTNSPLHRFKKPGSKNFQNIFSPSKVLHLSNIPPKIDEDFIRDLFSEYGTVEEFKFFAKDRRMALIGLASVDEAVTSLVEGRENRPRYFSVLVGSLTRQRAAVGWTVVETTAMIARSRFDSHPSYVVASLDKVLHDDYLCLVDSDKQQIKENLHNYKLSDENHLRVSFSKGHISK